MKYWFLRHRNSGSKGWQAMRGDQQRRWVLPWAQLPAPRPGTKRRIWGPFIGLWRWSWVLVETNQLEFTGQRSSDSYFQKRVENKGMDIKVERRVGGIGKLNLPIYNIDAMYTINIKWESIVWHRELLYALWLPKWEGNPKKKRYMYMYSQFTVLLTQHHNKHIVKQLSSNKS